MPSNLWRSVFFILAVLTPELSAAEPDLTTMRARSVLRRHCGSCHDGQPGQRSPLEILDYSQLVDPQRKLPPFVKPGSASKSQIYQFMEEGSMPPGTHPKVPAADLAVVREWIDGGAGAFPRRFDEAYVYSRILADQKAAGPEEGRNYRYFTLHPLVNGTANPELAKAKLEFRVALSRISKREVEVLKFIDIAEIVIRVDLRELGWSATPFRQIDREGKNLPSAFNVFDLLLLEYPFGEMPPNTPETAQLADIWLRPIEQVRPIAWLRADWLTKAVENPALRSDINRLINTGAKGRGPDAPAKADVAKLPEIPVPPPGKTPPIVAVDSWYSGDYLPKAPKVEVAVLNAAGKPATKFKPGERVKLEVRASEAVYIEVIQIDADGAVFAHELGKESRIAGNTPGEVNFNGKKEGLLLGDDPGPQRFVVFAAAEKFAPGELLQSKNEDAPIERYVHRFYELPKWLETPLKFDPAKMTRRVVSFEVVK